jgi:hypothetical protein
MRDLIWLSFAYLVQSPQAGKARSHRRFDPLQRLQAFLDIIMGSEIIAEVSGQCRGYLKIHEFPEIVEERKEAKRWWRYLKRETAC